MLFHGKHTFVIFLDVLRARQDLPGDGISTKYLWRIVFRTFFTLLNGKKTVWQWFCTDLKCAVPSPALDERAFQCARWSCELLWKRNRFLFIWGRAWPAALCITPSFRLLSFKQTNILKQTTAPKTSIHACKQPRDHQYLQIVYVTHKGVHGYSYQWHLGYAFRYRYIRKTGEAFMNFWLNHFLKNLVFNKVLSLISFSVLFFFCPFFFLK